MEIISVCCRSKRQHRVCKPTIRIGLTLGMLAMAATAVAQLLVTVPFGYMSDPRDVYEILRVLPLPGKLGELVTTTQGDSTIVIGFSLLAGPDQTKQVLPGDTTSGEQVASSDVVIACLQEEGVQKVVFKSEDGVPGLLDGDRVRLDLVSALKKGRKIRIKGTLAFAVANASTKKAIGKLTYRFENANIVWDSKSNIPVWRGISVERR